MSVQTSPAPGLALIRSLFSKMKQFSWYPDFQSLYLSYNILASGAEVGG